MFVKYENLAFHVPWRKRVASSRKTHAPDKGCQAVGGVKGQDEHVGEASEVFKREPDTKRDVQKPAQVKYCKATFSLRSLPKIKAEM